MKLNAVQGVSWLFVPGSRPDRFAKAAHSGASVVIADLEDAVAEADKESARASVAAALAAGSKLAVRINGVGSPWYNDDLALVAELSCIVLLPKAEDSRDAAHVVDAARSHLVVPIIESAAGVLRLNELARTPGVARLALGNADLSAQLGTIPSDQTALLATRSMLVLASAAAGVHPPIDGVTLALRNPEATRVDAAHARRLGFGGKLCVHPAQVEIVDAAFAPTDDEITWARRVLAPSASADDGVSVVDGRMVDRPIRLRAEAILAETARRAGR